MPPKLFREKVAPQAPRKLRKREKTDDELAIEQTDREIACLLASVSRRDKTPPPRRTPSPEPILAKRESLEELYLGGKYFWDPETVERHTKKRAKKE